MPHEIGEVETARLILRRLQERDVESLQLIGSDDLFELVPEIETPFNAAAWVRQKLEREVCAIGHVVVTKQERTVVGYVQISTDVTREGAYLSVGYWFGRMYWGKGYAAEALAAALARLQSTVTEGNQLIPVYAKMLPQNVASRRVLEKCGFVRSGAPNGAVNAQDMDWYNWPASAPRYRRPAGT